MIWIRSQNKKCIIESSVFHIWDKYDGSFEILANEKGYGSYSIGVYSTEEKALKALDMIQERIETNVGFKRKIDYIAEVHKGVEHYVYSKNVLQMPQDSEVE